MCTPYFPRTYSENWGILKCIPLTGEVKLGKHSRRQSSQNGNCPGKTTIHCESCCALVCLNQVQGVNIFKKRIFLPRFLCWPLQFIHHLANMFMKDWSLHQCFIIQLCKYNIGFNSNSLSKINLQNNEFRP